MIRRYFINALGGALSFLIVLAVLLICIDIILKVFYGPIPLMRVRVDRPDGSIIEYTVRRGLVLHFHGGLVEIVEEGDG